MEPLGSTVGSSALNLDDRRLWVESGAERPLSGTDIDRPVVVDQREPVARELAGGQSVKDALR